MWALQRRRDQSFQLQSMRIAETDRVSDQLSLAIDHESLRNVPVVSQQLLYQLVIGNCKRVFDPECLPVPWYLTVVIFAAYVQSDDLEALRLIFLMKRHQVGRLPAAGVAPGRLKIEQYNFAFEVGDSRACAV